MTLRALTDNYQLQEIKLNCNQSINIIEKPSFNVNRRALKREEKYI